MMRKFLFATAALIALAGPATAADMRLPVYKAAPIVPVWSWSGCYVGGHAGGLWAKSKDWIVRTPGGGFLRPVARRTRLGQLAWRRAGRLRLSIRRRLRDRHPGRLC